MKEPLIGLTAEIVIAHISNNVVAVGDVPTLITTVHGALNRLDQTEPEAPKVEPAVPVNRSIRPDALISLIDGKPYKMLRRHLAQHGLTPDEYRQRFGLKPDYPMVAANYAEKRRQLALDHGLGRKPH